MQDSASLPTLPKSFAERVLDLEEELDFKCELSVVKQLMELYTKAIEYYESVQNRKYLHYKDRLHQLLARPDVLSLLEKATLKRRPEPKKKTSSLTIGHFSHTNLLANRSAEKEIAVHLNNSSSLLRKLRDNIQSQCSSLANRLHQRQLKHRSIDYNYEQYESQMSALIEMVLEKKQATRALIESKYKAELDELKDLGGIGEIVRTEVKKRMEEEVSVAYADLDKEKHKRLARLKQDFAQ